MKNTLFASALFAALVLTACGGHSSGTNADTSQKDTVAAAPKAPVKDLLDSTSKQVGDTVKISDMK